MKLVYNECTFGITAESLSRMARILLIWYLFRYEARIKGVFFQNQQNGLLFFICQSGIHPIEIIFATFIFIKLIL